MLISFVLHICVVHILHTYTSYIYIYLYILYIYVFNLYAYIFCRTHTTYVICAYFNIFLNELLLDYY